MSSHTIPTIELKRRSVPAGLTDYMLEEDAVRQDITTVVDDLRWEPPGLVAAIARRQGLYEPPHPNIATVLAQPYAGGSDGQRLVAIMLRAGAVGFLTAPDEVDPWAWAEFTMMNVGDHSLAPWEAVDEVRHRSEASRARCRVGCESIVRRRAERCLACGAARDSRPGVRALHERVNHFCDSVCETGDGMDRRYRQEAMAFIFEQMAFLLAQVKANSLMCRHDVGWFGTSTG